MDPQQQTNSTHLRLLNYGLSDTEDMLKEFGNSITASMSLSGGGNQFKRGGGQGVYALNLVTVMPIKKDQF